MPSLWKILFLILIFYFKFKYALDIASHFEMHLYSSPLTIMQTVFVKRFDVFIFVLMIVIYDTLVFIDFQYKTCKDGSVLGVTVTRIALLTHCQALTQSCGYTEGESNTHTHTHRIIPLTQSRVLRQSCSKSVFSLCLSAEIIVNVLDFKKDVGLWHGILTVSHAPEKEKCKHKIMCSTFRVLISHFLLPQSVMNMMHVISIPYSLMKVNPLSWIQKVCQYKGLSVSVYTCFAKLFTPSQIWLNNVKKM